MTRGTIEAGRDSYLVLLADQKDAPELLGQLLTGWLEQNAEATPLFLADDRPADGSEPDPKLAVACGFEVTRPQKARVDGVEIGWDERLLVIRSYSYMQTMLAGLRRRLENAAAALTGLTPPRQRGKDQIETEGALLAAIAQAAGWRIYATNESGLFRIGWRTFPEWASASSQTDGVVAHAGNAKRSTSRPTTARMLKAFEGIDLVILTPAEWPATFLTALMPVHERILALLGLQLSLFTGLQSA